MEVNRQLVTRARDLGGCVVARSQMHSIVEETPSLEKVVEQRWVIGDGQPHRLLMPAFVAHEIVFPIDGPLGRYGQSLKETLRCGPKDADARVVALHQLLLRDQRIWLRRLSCLVQTSDLL